MNPHPSFRGQRIDRVLRGFTLLEILVVLSVMLVIVGISFGSLTGTMSSLALTNAGNKLTQICEIARQRAMSANVLTAVVAVTNLGTIKDGRAICILECPPGGPWRQTGEWEFLPDGITLDVSASSDHLNSFVANSPEVFPFNQGKMEAPVAFGDYKALPAGTYAARIFLPTGGLKNPSAPAKMQIVEGSTTGGKTAYSVTTGTEVPANYYRVTLLGATGGTKVERP